MKDVGNERKWTPEQITQAVLHFSSQKRLLTKKERGRFATFEKEVAGVDSFMSAYFRIVEEEDRKRTNILQQMFEKFDVNHDGNLELNEFAQLISTSVRNILSSDSAKLFVLAKQDSTNASANLITSRNIGDMESETWSFNSSSIITDVDIQRLLSDQDIIKLYNEIVIEAPDGHMTGSYFAEISKNKLHHILGLGNGFDQNVHVDMLSFQESINELGK